MFWVYILRSNEDNTLYCGHTDNLARRLAEHNRGDFGGGRTTRRLAGSWKLAWSSEAATRADAMQLERRIKKRGVARYLSDQRAKLNGQSPADGGINQ